MTRALTPKVWEKKWDPVFFGTAAGLVVFGFLMLSSVSGPSAYSKFGDAFWFVKHQALYGLFPGAIFLLILSRLDYRFLRRLAAPAIILTLVCLLIVFLPGVGAHWGTSRSWIYISGFSFQPVEVAKLSFIVFLAAWLDKIGEAGARDIYRGLIPFAGVVCLVSLILVFQPDLGSVSIMISAAIVMFYLAGARLKHLLLIVAAGASAFFLLIRAAPYRAARFTTFLHPELDPRGIGYHINQALLAIGSGGFFGLGFGHSRQKFLYLPEVEGDSIFAIIAEELGFALLLVFLAVLLFFTARGFAIAKAAPDRFGKLLSGGIVSWLALQSFVNIAGMLSLMPLTGVTLPFISYGGSSLLVSLAAIGIVLSVSRAGTLRRV